MCTGIAIAVTEMPTSLVEDGRLADRLYKRESRDEVQFHWWQVPSLIPVQWNGRLQVMPWGSKDRRSPLPYGGWISRELLNRGSLQNVHAEDVVIPANLGFHHGTWFLIVEGIKGILIRDRSGPVVYMVMEPSTNYYRNMTEQAPMMPELIGQVI